MALPLVDKDDFTGELSIAVNQYNSEALDEIIADANQEKYIKMLLGAELGDLFIADLVAGEPQTARFIDLNSPKTFELNGCVIHFDGIKKDVLRALYFDWTSQQAVLNLSSGNSTVMSEAATPDNHMKSTLTWNRIVSDNDALSCYIKQNSATYSEYKYQALYPLTIL